MPALSSAEAELYAIGSGAIEVLGATTLLTEWGYYDQAPILYINSSSALAVCKKTGPGRMKHIEPKMLAIQDWIKEGRLRVNKIGTNDNQSDLFTKAMNHEKLQRHGKELGLRGGPFGDGH